MGSQYREPTLITNLISTEKRIVILEAQSAIHYNTSGRKQWLFKIIHFLVRFKMSGMLSVSQNLKETKPNETF